MAEATFLRNNALPYPVYGAPWTVVLPILDADGDLVTGATGPDSEISKNGDTFADCTNELTEIATTSGMYYLSLTGTELTTDVAAIICKTTTSGAKTTPIVLYPRKLAVQRSGTSASGGSSTSTIVLDASASGVDDFYNGMLCVATIDSNIEARVITDYTGSTQTATVAPDWNVAPDNNDTFIVYLTDHNTTTAYVDKTGYTLTVTPPTAAAVATAVWQDATAGDFTTASSIGKSLYTSGVVPGAAGGVFIAGTNAATTVAITGNITGNLSGSVGSVTGAVGSVTGNVGGNVNGSVGSIATGGIAAASFAASAITATAIAADAITDAKVAADVTIASVTGAVGSVTGAVGSVTGNVGGNVTGSVGSVATGGIAAASFAAGAITAASIADGAIDRATFAADTGLQSIRSNTATAGSGTTITLDASASVVNDFYTNDLIFLTGGTGAGQARFISGYVGATKVATVASWATNPDGTSTFAILPFGAIPGASAPTAAQVATAVWQDATAGDFTTASSIGKSLYTAGAVPGAAGGVFIAGSNAATIVNITGNITGNLSGSVGSLTTNNDKIGYALTSGERNSVADALLDRDMSVGTDSGSTTVRTVRQALRFLRNKWSISGTTLTVCKEDDTASSWTATVTTDVSANPVTASDPAG